MLQRRMTVGMAVYHESRPLGKGIVREFRGWQDQAHVGTGCTVLVEWEKAPDNMINPAWCRPDHLRKTPPGSKKKSPI